MTTGRTRQLHSDTPKWVSSHQTNMLHEDFHNSVVPYRQDAEGYRLSAKGIAAHLIDGALTIGNYSWRLEGFIRAVATRLLTHHEVWLEVRFNKDIRGHAPFAVMEIDGIKRPEIGRLIQEQQSIGNPSNWAQGKSNRDRHFEAEEIVHVTLPETYPSQLLTQVVCDLAEVGVPVPPAWVMDNMYSQRGDVPHYDVGQAMRTERLRIAQAALPIGWTAREIFHQQSRQLGDYYYHWRELRFLHFLSSMRTRGEEALRQVLTVAGARCGFTATVTAHGIHTAHEVEALIPQFEAGEIPFSQVSKIIHEVDDGSSAEQRRVV